MQINETAACSLETTYNRNLGCHICIVDTNSALYVLRQAILSSIDWAHSEVQWPTVKQVYDKIAPRSLEEHPSLDAMFVHLQRRGAYTHCIEGFRFVARPFEERRESVGFICGSARVHSDGEILHIARYADSMGQMQVGGDV